MSSDLSGVALSLAKCLGICQDEDDSAGNSSEGVSHAVRQEAGKLASCLWNLTLGGVVNLVCLRCNADRLEHNMCGLMGEMVDVMRQVDAAEDLEGGERLRLVETWAKSVEDLNTQVEESLTSLRSRKYIKFLCLSYAVTEQQRKINDLWSERAKFTEWVGPPVPPAVESQLIPNIHGGDDPGINQVRDHLADDESRLIAVHDTTRVGETTVLQVINNEPSGPGAALGFDVVIWVPLSGNPSVEELQTEICRRLRLPLSADEKSRASALNRALSRWKFLLLLDDVRDPDIVQTLKRVGIPDLSRKKSKIVLSTAFHEIARLCARRVVLGPLDGTQSWELFYGNLSEEAKNALTRDADMKTSAERIVQLCSGLPPVIVNVSMAISELEPSSELWDNVLFELEDSTDKFRGMELIPRSFQLNFDYLPSDALRMCFLYCSLFPERCNIDKTQLVEYWVGEGFLDGGNQRRGIGDARKHGSLHITHLVRAFLLCASEKTVMLPESARRMAVSLTNGPSGGRKKYVVFAGKGCLVVPEVESWSDAERVSLMQNNIHRLPKSIPQCPHIRTLLINANPQLVFAERNPVPASSFSLSSSAAPALSLSTHFLRRRNPFRRSEASSSPSSPMAICDFQTPLFGLMAGLRVLDLSSTSIDLLPSDIQLLRELTYLNLSNTNISDLPEGLGALVKLRQLDLRGTKSLKQIRFGAICTLRELQALNLYDGSYHLCFSDARECGSWENLLTALEKLDELGVNIKTQLPLQLHLALPETSVRFRSSTRFLTVTSSEEIFAVEEQRLDVCLFPNLEVLQLLGLPLSMVVRPLPRRLVINPRQAEQSTE